MSALNYTSILKNSKTILLVDWASEDIPLTLLKAGFKVISYSPGQYTIITLEAGNNDKLTYMDIEGPPEAVDIVNVYRPEEEHAAIIANYILPLKAKVLWLHPPVTSVKTATLANENNLTFIEGVNIAEVARAVFLL